MAWLLLSRQQAFFAAYSHARFSAFVWVTTIALCWVAAGLRAVRLALLLRERPSLEHAQIASLHSVAATLLPAKLGEFVLPALLRQRGTPIDASLGLLFLGRLLDLGVVLAVVAMALLGWGLASAVVGVLAVALLLACLPLLRWLLGLTHRLQSLREHLARITLMERLQLSGVTLALWVALWSQPLLTFDSLGVHASLENIVGGAALSSLGFALPISGVASVGPAQAAWAWALHRDGVAIEQATFASLALSLISLGAASLFAALVTLLRALHRRSSRE